jgi:large subunit ribosomal protein L25
MNVILHAQPRDPSIKAKQLRKEGLIPGCIYGKSTEPCHIQIKATDLQKCLKIGAVKLHLKVGSDKYFTSIQEVQKNNVGTQIQHISLHAFDSNEKVSMHIPIHLDGKALGQTSGGVLKQQLSEVTVTGLAKDIPDEIVVDITKLELGSCLHISDLPTSSEYKIKEGPDQVIVACGHPKLKEITDTPPVAPSVTEMVDEEQSEAA